jgi:hypothetical protein
MIRKNVVFILSPNSKFVATLYLNSPWHPISVE